MSGGETSGIDLARVALRAAMEAARKNGGGGQKAKQQPRAVTTVRRDGRDPMGLGVAIGALVTERAWELPAVGATLRERWAAIAPELSEGDLFFVVFEGHGGDEGLSPVGTAPTVVQHDLQSDLGFVAGEVLVGGDLAQVLQGAVAGDDDSPVDLGAGEVLTDGGGVEPGLQDGRRVGVLGEFIVAQQSQHTVVFVLGGGHGGRSGEEPGGAFDLSQLIDQITLLLVVVPA
ncbi:hypothetical protein [Streptomyces collinus]|uniref:hypothetical protein n=1 Tax=Streptomyces collinus TaxID=42684 RepID=UPI00378F8CDB